MKAISIYALLLAALIPASSCWANDSAKKTSGPSMIKRIGHGLAGTGKLAVAGLTGYAAFNSISLLRTIIPVAMTLRKEANPPAGEFIDRIRYNNLLRAHFADMVYFPLFTYLTYRFGTSGINSLKNMVEPVSSEAQPEVKKQ